MEQTLLPNYKQTTTARGYKYNYYFSPSASTQNPTLLLVHGFPGLSFDWHNQITYFKNKGFGLVVPDMLGYGGTDKPEDPSAYLQTLLAKDLIDIIDHEKATNVIAIGHDWGSKTTSVLANLHADRFLGFAFFALGYVAPNPLATYQQILPKIQQMLGYQVIGYWEFFASPDFPEIGKKHIDSFWDLVHAKDERLWKSNLGPTGSLRIWLESDSRTPRASYFNDELQALYSREFSKGGLLGPTNYYRVAVNPSYDLEDAKQIPLANYKVTKPVFVGAGSHDIAPAEIAKDGLTRFCTQGTFKVFETGHWVPQEAPEEVNSELDKWIDTVISPSI